METVIVLAAVAVVIAVLAVRMRDGVSGGKRAIDPYELRGKE